jgi:membrane-associated HD superfamily phosphohydrolase
LDEYKASNAVAVDDNKRREENEKNLRKDLSDDTARNTKLTEEKNYLREQAVSAVIEAKSFKSRNGQLEEQMNELSRQLALVKEKGNRPSSGSSGSSGRNPPPEQVEGLIQRVDGDLVTLSIGSDAGLRTGHTMYVFGLAGNVGYRGEIVLKDVTPKVSVGQVIKGRQVSRVRIGDTVASEIMPRR